MVQMYHKLSKTSQEELRSGIKDIKDQEEKQSRSLALLLPSQNR